MDNHSQTAKEIRLTVLDMIFRAQVSHIGSCFSCIDILTVLYAKADPKIDRLVVSKGWVAAAVYALNVKYEYMPQEAIDTYCDGKSPYIGLIEPLGYFGCEIGGGSMQLGFAAAVGLALAKKIKGEPGVVYCLMSDGELQGGIVWESALIAVQHKLDNLVVIVDKNSWQAMGKTKDILSSYFPSKGWDEWSIDGHSYEDIKHAIDCTFAHIDVAQLKTGMPQVILAKTIKGKGWKRAENNNLYHYKSPSAEEYEEAKAELEHGTN